LIEAPELTDMKLTDTTRSGRAAWDERGNTVWEWQTSPGIFSRDVSSQQLQSLQANELKLVDQHSRHSSACTQWKQNYQDRFTRAPTGETELIMPPKKKGVSGKHSVFDQFLRHLGLPA